MALKNAFRPIQWKSFHSETPGSESYTGAVQ